MVIYLLKAICDLVASMGLDLLPPVLLLLHSPHPQVLGLYWGKEETQSALWKETPDLGPVGSGPSRPGGEGNISSLQSTCLHPSRPTVFIRL